MVMILCETMLLNMVLGASNRIDALNIVHVIYVTSKFTLTSLTCNFCVERAGDSRQSKTRHVTM
jgi:hypothetical protein